MLEDGIGKWVSVKLCAFAEVGNKIIVLFDVGVYFIGEIFGPLTAFDASNGGKNFFIDQIKVVKKCPDVFGADPGVFKALPIFG